jgi:phage terminase small subunit
MRTQITADRVLEELARIAFSDLRNVAAFGHIGDKNVFSIKNSEDMSDDAAATISEIKVKRTFKPNPMTDDDGNPEPPIEVEEASVKMHDKLGSLRLLAKHLGLTPDKVEHMGKDGGPIQIREELDISNLSPKELALYAKIKAANPDD